MNKQFLSTVLKFLPEWRYAHPFFYKPPVNHILCGFCFDKHSRDAYVHAGAFPLYEPLTRAGIHLSYTDNIARIITHGVKPKIQAEEFVKIIQLHQGQIVGLDEIENFTNKYMPKVPIGDGDIIRRQIYILNMIMLGNEEEAKRHFSLLLKSEYFLIDVSRKEKYNLDKFETALSHGIEFAQSTLLEWERKNKEDLGVIGD